MLNTDDRDLRSAETLAKWLDRRGLDPLLGFLLPGIGDVAGTVAGLYTVFVALRRRAPAIVVARMLMNLGIDALVGMVPIAGDLFDLGWKANQKNVELLRARPEGGRSSARDWLAVGGAALLLVGTVVLAALGVRWLWRLVTR